MKVLFDIPTKAVDLVLVAALLHADEDETKATKEFFENNKDSVFELTADEIGEKGMEFAIALAAVVFAVKAKGV